MRFILPLMLAIVGVLGISASAYSQTAPTSQTVEYVENECLLQLNEAALNQIQVLFPDYSREEIRLALQQIGGLEYLSELGISEGAKVDCSDPNFKALADLLDTNILNFAEPNFLYSISAPATNDPGWGQLWGIHGTYGTEAYQAWDVSRGSEEVVVAVIDTGVDYNHPDLQANMWHNTGEIPNNGIDDDGNGYIDDYWGLNGITYVQPYPPYSAGNPNAGNPWDDHGHGTHCSGTIAGIDNNGVGVVGVAPNVKIMALKFLSSTGSGSTQDAIDLVKYMTEMKNRGVNIRVSSNSWGGGGSSSAMLTAINAAEAAGIIFIAAAGNSNSDNDSSPHYPSTYKPTQDSLIAVASHTSSGARSSFSCWGRTTVDLTAPGSAIYSTLPNGGYASWSGTSMATPHVSGIAALLASVDPSLTPRQMKDLILANTKPIPSFDQSILVKGIADAERVLNAADPNEFPVFVAPISDQAYDGAVQSSASIQFGAYDPDGNGESIGRVSSCTARVVGAVSSSAYNFNQTFQPFCVSENCQQDVYGQGTKTLYGIDGQIFSVNEHDEVTRVDGEQNTSIGAFPGAFSDPTILTSPPGPPAPDGSTADCTLDPNSNAGTIVVTWEDDYYGEFAIEVTIADAEEATATDSFNVTVTSNPPTITPPSEQNYNLADGTVTADFTAVDPDGDDVECSVALTSLSGQPPFLNTVNQYEPYCVTEGCHFADTNNSPVKLFFTRNSGEYLTVDSSNTVRRYFNGGVSVLGVFPNLFANPSLFTSPLQPLDASSIVASVVGGQVSFDLSEATVGSFNTELTCWSRGGSASASFVSNITSSQPTLGFIPDQSGFPGETLNLAYQLNNGEGMATTIVSFLQSPLQRANEIANQFGLYYYDQPSDDFGGSGNKYVLGSGYLQLRRFTDSSGKSFTQVYSYPSLSLIGVIPGYFFDDPWALVNPNLAPPGPGIAFLQASAVVVTTPSTVTDTTYRLRLRSSKRGNYYVDRIFDVQVSNHAPTVSFTSTHSLNGAQNTLSVPLTVHDIDGQTVQGSILSVQNVSALVTEIKSTKRLVERDSGYNGPGFAFFSEAENRWYYLVPSGGGESPACHLKTDIGNIIATLPASSCINIDHARSEFLGMQPSVGTPTAIHQDNGSGNHTVTLQTNGSRLSLVSIVFSDGVPNDNFIAHLFFTNTNRAPVATIPSQGISLPEAPLVQTITVFDPDGDALQHSVTAEACAQTVVNLDNEYGFTYHPNCSAGSDRCPVGDGVQAIYSSVLNQAVYVFDAPEENEVILALHSDGGYPLAVLPGSYFHDLDALVHPSPPLPAEAPSVELSSTHTATTQVTVRTSVDTCVQFETTDSDLKDTVGWTVVVTDVQDRESGLPVIDSDRDGVSDAQERLAGTNVYDAGHVLIPLTSPAQTIFTQFSNTAVSAIVTNLKNDSLSSGAVTLFNTNGESLASSQFTLAAGEVRKIELLAAESLADERSGYAVLTFNGLVSGALEVNGDSSLAARRVLSLTSFANGSGYPVFAPYSEGRQVGDEVLCDQELCSATLVILNSGTLAEDITIEIFNADGTLVTTVEETVYPNSLSTPVDLSSLDEATELGSFRVTPASKNALLHTYVEHVGSSDSKIYYSYAIHGVRGSGHDRESFLLGTDEEVSAEITLLNTQPLSTDVRVSLFSVEGAVLSDEYYQLLANSRLELDFTDHLAGENGIALIQPKRRESTIAVRRLYLDQEEEELQLGEFIYNPNDSSASLELWESLLSDFQSAPPSGEVKAGEQVAFEPEQPVIEGRKWSITATYRDDEGNPVADAKLKVCKVKRNGQLKLPCLFEVTTDALGQVLLSDLKRKMKFVLLDVFGNKSSVFKMKNKSKCSGRRCRK
ncbi:MAG: S8 family serine peptidase [Bdellovibrionales bacterium]|nr:S8 family serine peptidase [Bdellovibrionales bacterium]